MILVFSPDLSQISDLSIITPAWFSRGHALKPMLVIPPLMIHVALSFTW